MKMIVASSILILLLSGCVSYKNSSSIELSGQPEQREQIMIPLKIAVLAPSKPKIDFTKNPKSKWEYESKVNDAQHLVSILKECHLFSSVKLTHKNDKTCEVLLKALPRTIERSWLEDPWLLMFAGLLPFQTSFDRGFSFEFVRGGTGVVIFDWREDALIGVWAPVVSVSSDNWKINKSSGAYWPKIRSCLIEALKLDN